MTLTHSIKLFNKIEVSSMDVNVKQVRHFDSIYRQWTKTKILSPIKGWPRICSIIYNIIVRSVCNLTNSCSCRAVSAKGNTSILPTKRLSIIFQIYNLGRECDGKWKFEQETKIQIWKKKQKFNFYQINSLNVTWWSGITNVTSIRHAFWKKIEL